MEYRVYEIGAEVGLSGVGCVDKKNNNLVKSIYQAIEKNEFVAIHAASRDGSEIDNHTIQVNPRYIEYIVEMDIDNDPTPHGGKR